ncbi:MAG: hypothetical protein PHP89_04905, partial [Candidatus Omnitrophica bacterium]|nr:hypothetical protein [Candidatus Omnitrophota bacterium]
MNRSFVSKRYFRHKDEGFRFSPVVAIVFACIFECRQKLYRFSLQIFASSFSSKTPRICRDQFGHI